jgi:Recombination endonuclease VII
LIFTQLKSSDIKDTRENILKDQDGKCALCGCVITEETGYSLDHQHMLKKETIGEDGAGLVRGVLCRSCNIWEGKVWNNTLRFMQPENVQDRIMILENLIKYYKKDNYNLIHPNEKIKEKIVSKKNYNKLKKEYMNSGLKKIFPEYPKSGKLTKSLSKLFSDFEIEPYN